MSTRLQVVLDDGEMKAIRGVARARHVTVSEWVRQTLRKERQEYPVTSAERKIQCVREAAAHRYPTADVAEILRDIERGRSAPGDA